MHAYTNLLVEDYATDQILEAEFGVTVIYLNKKMEKKFILRRKVNIFPKSPKKFNLPQNYNCRKFLTNFEVI